MGNFLTVELLEKMSLVLGFFKNTIIVYKTIIVNIEILIDVKNHLLEKIRVITSRNNFDLFRIQV